MMALETTLDWLDTKLATAPSELADDVRQLVSAAGRSGTASSADAVAGLLADAAMAAFDAIVDGRGGRESALRLLSADAALTLAFEAAAELGGDVAALCRRLGPLGEFGARLRGRSDVVGA